MAPTSAPFLRWAGGKRKLLPALSAIMPASPTRVIEPFVGGGAFYLGIEHRPAGGIISDVNPHLINTYRQVQNHVDELIKELKKLAKDTSEQEFYRVRALDPATLSDTQAAARFIYNNKLNFNGLNRENSKGGWNVPYGHLKNPTVCDEPRLRAASAALAGATILLGSYELACKQAAAGDFVYLDPPYIPLTPTASFSRYAKDDFLEPQQRELAQTIKDLTARGVHVLLSNSDTPLTRSIYGGLNFYELQVQRNISAASASRTKVGEVLATNYPEALMANAAFFAPVATAPTLFA